MIRVPIVRTFLTVACLTVLGFAGCGGITDSPSRAKTSPGSASPPELAAKAPVAALPQDQPPGGAAQVSERRAPAEAGKLQRQIIYDADVRIVVEDFRNKQKEEARLLKHLEESTGKLEEILAVEREISRVREDLERMEG